MDLTWQRLLATSPVALPLSDGEVRSGPESKTPRAPLAEDRARKRGSASTVTMPSRCASRDDRGPTVDAYDEVSRLSLNSMLEEHLDIPFETRFWA